MDPSRGFLVASATLFFSGLCMPNSCLPGYRPYTCTSCIKFTKDELEFSSNTCKASSGVLLQMEEVNEVLWKYMEVYNRPQYWTGYEIHNGKAVVPGTNKSIDMHILNDESCSDNCCLAWQLEPYGPIAVNCSKKLPAICITCLNFSRIHADDADSSGSGAGNSISVLVDGEMQMNMDNHNVMFGANVTLSCCHAQGANVQWYRNTEALSKDVNVSTSESVLRMLFTTPGVYQCKVTKDATTDVRTVTLCGVDGKPGDIYSLTAIPLSQTELQVTWLPPTFLGTVDPLLLRYNVYYSLDDILNENSSKVEGVTPPLRNDAVEVLLSELSKGHRYVIGVVAVSTAPTSHFVPKLNTLASTYGLAPIESVSGLKVQRLKDDEKALVVSWERADLSLPEGPVSLYLVEYRDAQQALSNRAYVQPESSSLVLWEVANANDYEVRVAILVEVNRDPLQYSSSQWTKWIRVIGTTSELPKPDEVKPTSSKGSGDVILAAVLVPLAVVLVLVLLMAATLILGCRTRRERSYSVSVNKEKGELPKIQQRRRKKMLL